jgi:hypothetical protein
MRPSSRSWVFSGALPQPMQIYDLPPVLLRITKCISQDYTKPCVRAACGSFRKKSKALGDRHMFVEHFPPPTTRRALHPRFWWDGDSLGIPNTPLMKRIPLSKRSISTSTASPSSSIRPSTACSCRCPVKKKIQSGRSCKSAVKVIAL